MESMEDRRPRGRPVGVFIALLLVIATACGAVACGSGTDPSPSPSPTATVDLATVPDLSSDNLQKAEAEGEIENAGLVPVVQPTFTGDVPAGQVVNQSPEAGKQVTKGGEVIVWVSLGAKMAAIPKLVGEKAGTVSRLIKNLSLVGKKVNGASVEYPKGTCYKQLPGPKDQVPTGSTVVYYISSGLPTVAVPNVVGMTMAGAQAALDRRNLALAGTGKRHSAVVPKGKVVSQSVPAGTDVAVQTAVEITVSSGPADSLLTVPDVTGEYLDSVLPMLQMGGFQMVVVDRVTSDKPKGIVIRQLPRVGSRMGALEELLLTVSGGPLFQ